MMSFDEVVARLVPPEKPAPRKASSLDHSTEAVERRKRERERIKNPPERPARSYDAAALVAMDLPDPTYVSRPWIAEGVTLLCGRPKIGKTTLLAPARAAGERRRQSSSTRPAR